LRTELTFQKTPWDLRILLAYTLLASTFVVGIGAGSLLAILLVLVAPGYVIVAAIFPEKTDIDWVERLVLSSGLSIGVVPLFGLVLNVTPLGFRLVPVVALISAFTVVVGCVAYWRRMRLPQERRLSLNVQFNTPHWRAYRALDKVLTIILATGTAVVGGTLVYVAISPVPAQHFTEFYILGPGGNASDYPTNLSVNETGIVILGIVNHEATTVTYTARVDLVGVRIQHNSTLGYNQTFEVNRTTMSWYNLTLAEGRNWTQAYDLRISYPGLWKVEFLLFKDSNIPSPYRQLYFYVRVI